VICSTNAIESLNACYRPAGGHFPTEAARRSNRLAMLRQDGLGLAARIVVPLGATVEMLVRRLPGQLAVRPSAVGVATYVAVASTGLTSVFVLCALHLRGVRRTRSHIAQLVRPKLVS
jgi:hypothetical protein